MLKEGHTLLFSRSNFSGTIRTTRAFRKSAYTSTALLLLLVLAIICPISFRSATPTEAASGTPKQSTLTFTSTSNNASVSLDLTGASATSGTFATSSNNEKASFSLATDNYTGYELFLKSSSSTTTLSNGTNTINAIGSDGITSSQFSTNTWGLLPSKYNCATSSCTENTTNYYRPTTAGFLMEQTSSASSTANTYTVGLGLKADYNTPAGTYTSSAIIAEYVARPISYSIAYDKGNITGTPTNIPSTQSDLVSSTSVTLSSTTPSITGYTFTGWCLGTVSTNTTTKVDSCTGTGSKTFQPGGSFGIDQTASNDVTLHAMWSIKTFTLTVQNGGNTTVTGSGTYQYGQTVTITATPTASTTCITYSTPTWTKTSGAGTLNQTSGNSVTFTMGEGTATVTATSSATNVQQDVTLSKGTGVSGITIAGTSYTGTSASLECGTYNISGSYSSGYEFSSWSSTGGVTISSASSASTTLAVTGAGTLTLTGQEPAPGQCTSTATCMQTYAFSSCTTSGATLTDARDGNTYTVKKIGNLCWMTANLKITGTISANLSNFTGNDVNITVNSLTSGDTYTQARSTLSTDTSYPGAYYNYCAASAGTICKSSNSTEASSDICPKGWRLPTNAEFGTIGSSSGSTTNVSAFSPIYSGCYYNGSLIDTGSYGNWWSSTASNTTRRYRLYYNSGKLVSGDNILRQVGGSVRCVLDTRTISDFTYMQDVTSTAVTNTTEGATATLTDKRDSKTYTVKKINGALWMTQNLRYLGDTGSAAKTMIIGNNNSNVANKSITLYSLDSSNAGNFNAYSSATCGSDSTAGYTHACVYDSGSTSTGVWYNYYAATAGTISTNNNQDPATSDICPKNWHLPSGPNTTANTDFNKLVGNTTSGSQNPTAGLTAFSAVAGGRYRTGSLSNTENGYWWSSTAFVTTAFDTTARYYLHYNSSDGQFSGDDYYKWFGGYFVRCVRSS